MVPTVLLVLAALALPSAHAAAPKRGLALSKHAGEADCADLKLFSSLRPWFYGWGPTPSSSNYSKCALQHDSGFIPMLWGRNSVNFTVWHHADALLGFNEPNHISQSNLLPAEAAALWPQVLAKARTNNISRIGSPAAAPCGGGPTRCHGDTTDWFDKFFAACAWPDSPRCNINFLATHDYACNPSKLHSFLTELHARYQLPIWLTEFNCGDGGANASAARHLAYMKEALPILESLPFVERYSWMSVLNTKVVGSALVDPHGELTTLGKYYTTAPSHPAAPTTADRKANHIVVHINATVLNTLPAQFVSFTMDAGAAAHWSTFKHEFWDDPLSRALAAGLAPAIFRFGGTTEDYTKYVMSDSLESKDCSPLLPSPTRPCITLNSTQLDAMAAFAQSAGWDLVFGANVGTSRSTTNEWDPTQLAALLRYASNANITFRGLELGNEPDLMCHHGEGADREIYSCHHAPPNSSWPDVRAITPGQLAKDYSKFTSLVHAAYPDAMIIGNDLAEVSKLETYGGEFLRNLSAPLDAFSWHFYYGPGSSRPHGLKPTQFSEPTTLDRFLTDATKAAAIWKANGHGAKLWLGETSSTYGGGTANASASFVAGFMWLDKLGIAAALGHSAVMRQTFAHSSYSVIGARDHEGKWDSLPNPDYWSTLLWRRLVGKQVLGTSLALGREVRAYAFCAAKGRGAVTLVLLNTKSDEADVEVSLPSGPYTGELEAYMLTSYPGLQTSRDVFLNGHVLRLVDEQTGELPATPPALTGFPLRMAPKSYGFVVLPEASVTVCV